MKVNYEGMVEILKQEISRREKQYKLIAEDYPDKIQMYVTCGLHEVMGMMDIIESAYGFEHYEELNEIYEEFHNKMREEYGVA